MRVKCLGQDLVHTGKFWLNNFNILNQKLEKIIADQASSAKSMMKRKRENRKLDQTINEHLPSLKEKKQELD